MQGPANESLSLERECTLALVISFLGVQVNWGTQKGVGVRLLKDALPSPIRERVAPELLESSSLHLFYFMAGRFACLMLVVHSTLGCWHEVHSNGPSGCCCRRQSGVGFQCATLHDSIICTTGQHDGRGTDGERYFWTRPCIFQNSVTSLL